MQLEGSPKVRHQLTVSTHIVEMLAGYSPFRVLQVEQQVHTVGMGDTISDIPHLTGTSPWQAGGPQ